MSRKPVHLPDEQRNMSPYIHASLNHRRIVIGFTVILAAGILASAGGCGLIEKPNAQIAGVKFQDISVTKATMLFEVKVNNPYSVPLPLSNVDYALASHGQQFLTGKADVQGEVPAKGSKVLGVPVQLSYLELIKAVKGAKPGASIPYTADLGLLVDVPVLGPSRIPMSEEGQIAIPTASTLLEQLKGLAK